MALTKISSNEIQPAAITSDLISADVSLGVKISNVSIANSSYTILDDTAVDTAGGYIVITGAGFNSGAQVIIGGTNATSVTRVSSTELRAQVPAKSAATYNVYVVNTDGSTGIRVNGLTYSALPTWVTGSTLDNQAVDVAFDLNFDATSAVSYSNTSAIPAGTTLLANGYFYGTVTGIAEETTYSFTVVATDAENQDSPRTFSVTVTVGPPPAALYTWGRNNYGQLGLGDVILRSSPVQVGSDTTWNNISFGNYNTIATKADGTLWTWGYNPYGQLGLGDVISRSSPTQVGSGTTWDKVSIATYNTIATKTDGTLWTWGINIQGQLGLGNIIDRSSPVQVGSDTTWNNISIGQYNTIATKTDGTLWTWGLNNYGQLGLGDIIDKSSPVQVGSGTTWNLISFGRYSTVATKTDGTLWTWGLNDQGQLGLSDIIFRSSPTQVGSGNTWNKVSVGRYVTIATKTDNTLWTWGYNLNGQLGLGDIINRSSPVQVGSDTTWNNISTGVNTTNTIATKTDGTLWTWGQNGYGQLGLGDIIDRSSPVQVGSDTTWNNISSGTYATIATKTV